MYLVYNTHWTGDGVFANSLMDCFETLEAALPTLIHSGEGVIHLKPKTSLGRYVPMITGNNSMNYWHIRYGYYEELFYPNGATVLYKHHGYMLRVGEIKSNNCRINKETLKPEDIQYEIDGDHTIKHEHIQSVIDVESILPLLDKLPVKE